MFCTRCGASMPDTAAFCPQCGAPAAGAVAPAAAGGPPGTATVAPAAGVLYGGFWRRFWAYVIDGFLVGAVTVPIGLAFGVPLFFAAAMRDFSAETLAAMIGASMMLAVIRLAIWWLYFALMESSAKQATLGKLALGLRVTDLAGRRLSFGRATGRWFGHVLSSMIFMIGFIMVAFTEKKQGLHDMLAGTLVVRRVGSS